MAVGLIAAAGGTDSDASASFGAAVEVKGRPGPGSAAQTEAEQRPESLLVTGSTGAEGAPGQGTWGAATPAVAHPFG